MGHTKGPWTVIDGFDENGEGVFPSVLIHGTEEQYRDTLGRNGIVINCSHDQEAKSLNANAKLIAAAPELLEALESMLIQVEDDLSSGFVDVYFANERIKKAKQAINNAKS